jgi:Ca-activated chloride channel family protein
VTRLFTTLTGLDLAAPGFLLLALLPPLALLLRRLSGAPAVRFAAGQFVRRRIAGPGGGRSLPRTVRGRLVGLPAALAVCGLLLVVVAVARPVRKVAVPRVKEGIDIVLCIDVSSSMALRDMDPERTRLDVAKEAADSFLAGRPGDRIGLISFARYPDLRCPPTLDHAALAELMSSTDFVESDGPEDATGIGTAAARAADVLRRGSARSKVVIVFTDGEENVARADTPDEIAPIHAAQLCEELGVKVHAIAAGLGGQGPSGEFVPLDTRQLERLAERTGGKFFAARDASAVAGVYREIDALEKVEFEEPLYRTEESFRPFLLAALVLLGLGALLGATVLRVRP